MAPVDELAWGPALQASLEMAGHVCRQSWLVAGDLLTFFFMGSLQNELVSNLFASDKEKNMCMGNRLINMYEKKRLIIDHYLSTLYDYQKNDHQIWLEDPS